MLSALPSRLKLISLNVLCVFQVLRVLGTIIFRALDYGLGEHDERILSHDLQDLIDGMTCLEDEDEDEAQWQDDEGIGKDAEDEEERQRQADNKKFTFFDVVMVSRLLLDGEIKQEIHVL